MTLHDKRLHDKDNSHLRENRSLAIKNRSTSLTPYGASFWALILAACGGGGGGGGAPATSGTPKAPEPTAPAPAAPAPAAPAPETTAPVTLTSKSGYVYDGPVKGATVYIDVDGDGDVASYIGLRLMTAPHDRALWRPFMTI